jgi:hypothetical protein
LKCTSVKSDDNNGINLKDIPEILTTIIYILFNGLLTLFGLAILLIVIYFIFIDPFISSIFWTLVHILLILFFSWFFVIHLCIYFFKNAEKVSTIDFWKGFLNSEKCLQSSSFCQGLLLGNIDSITNKMSDINVYSIREKLITFVTWIKNTIT